MEILPLHQELVDYAIKHNLKVKLEKQIRLMQDNLKHPGLHVELLEPKHLRFFSFRIDKRYRAIFIFRNKNIIEIIDVNDHYE